MWNDENLARLDKDIIPMEWKHNLFASKRLYISFLNYPFASIFIVFMGLISLITGLFCVEALSIANAIKSS